MTISYFLSKNDQHKRENDLACQKSEKVTFVNTFQYGHQEQKQLHEIINIVINKSLERNKIANKEREKKMSRDTFETNEREEQDITLEDRQAVQ